MMKIHPTAIISKKAKLESTVSVGPYTVIEDNVRISGATQIGAHCVIQGNTTIGKKCDIFHGASIGSRPQDLKYKGEKSYLEIGDNNIIREFCTINLGTGEGGKTIIGNNNLLMAYAHVAHDCRVGNRCVLANCGTLAGHVVIEDDILLSGFAAVHQFVRVGKLSIVAGLSKAVQDIPPFATCDGHPARVYGLNLVGLKRHGISQGSIKALGHAFKVLFNSGLPLKKALAELAKEKHGDPQVLYLMDFIKNSARGIVRSCRSSRDSEE